jgi:hypothetical protein
MDNRNLLTFWSIYSDVFRQAHKLNWILFYYKNFYLEIFMSMLFRSSLNINWRTGESSKRYLVIPYCFWNIFQSNNKQSNTTQSTIDEVKETNYLQQLTAGLITFLSVRTSLMKLYCMLLLYLLNINLFFYYRYEQISSAVKRNEHNVRLENYLDEITLTSQIDMSSLNIPILNPIRQLLK